MKRFNPSLAAAPVAASEPATNPATILPVGTRIHCILYGGKDGILYHVRGEQSPHTCRSLGGGVGVTGGTADFDIVWLGDGAHTSCVPEALVRDSVQWKIRHDQPIASADEIKAALDFAARKQAEREAEQKRKEQARADERAALPKKYPFLKPLKDGGRATANLKTELQRAFPGVKFSVTQSRGSSYIDCRWELGPTVDQVNAIAAKYEEGHFDGMTDSYEYNHDNVFPDVFGGGRGVSTSRNWPHELNERIARDLCVLQRVEYTGAYTPHLLGKGDARDVQQHVNILLSQTSWPVGAGYKGVEFNPDRTAWAEFRSRMFQLHGAGWASHDNRSRLAPEDLAQLIQHEANHERDDHWCRLVFDLPPSTINAQPSTGSAGATITATKHTKHGYPIWVVQLANRVDRPEFERLRDACKALGGWYSSYRGGGAIPGFTFKDEGSAKKFAHPEESETPAPAPNLVPPEKQEAILASITTAAQPGATVGPFTIPVTEPMPSAPENIVSVNFGSVPPRPRLNPLLARLRPPTHA